MPSPSPSSNPAEKRAMAFQCATPCAIGHSNIFHPTQRTKITQPNRHLQQRQRALITMVGKRPIASRVASSALTLLIKSMCTVSDDLSVDIDASSNRAILSGQIKAVNVTTSRICLNGFMVSAGAALYTDEISIQPPSPGTATPRLAKPLAVSIQASLTESDLNRDGPVRDGLEILLRQILATGLSGMLGRMMPVKIGGIEYSLDGVELADKGSQKRAMWPGQQAERSEQGKLILHAHATMTSGQVLRFSVRTGLCTVNDGNVIKLDDPELIWRQMSLPIITIGMIGIKLEDTTKLTHVEIDRGMLSGDGIMVFGLSNDVSKRVGSTATRSTRTGGGGGVSRRTHRLPQVPSD